MRQMWVLTALFAVSFSLSACASETAGIFETDSIDDRSTVLGPDEPLEGFYVVAAIDGGPVESAFPNTRPAVTIDPRRIHFQSQCVFRDWAWSREAGAVQTVTWTYGASEQPVGMCARGVTQYEQTIIEAISAIGDINRDVTGNLTVEVGGHTLRLDRQNAPHVSLRGQWKLVSINRSDPPVGSPIVFVGNDTQLYWEPLCAGQYAEFTIDGNRWSARQANPDGQIVCQIGIAPYLREFWSGLEAANQIEWADQDRMRIFGPSHSVVLQRWDGGR